MLEEIKRDFIKFAKNNPLYFVCSIIYYFMTVSMFGGDPISFLVVLVFYAISLFIVFTSAGEKLMRALEGVRKLETKEEKDQLLPLFEEVYMQAKEHNPELEHVELCVIDKMTVNACAIGKHTIAITKGAMETFSTEELKALIAHEIAHIINGDTIAKLYAVIGNGVYTFFVVLLRTVLIVAEFVQALYKRPGSERLFIIVLHGIVEIIIFCLMFLLQLVASLNSRKNEYKADKYAFDLGYGEKLLAVLYMLEKMKLGDNGMAIQKLIASHPRITARIEQLETLLDQESTMQSVPLPLN